VRQIALGKQGWSSADGGKTWKKSKVIDRRHYFIAHTPIRFRADEKIPPFDKVGTATANDETLLHVRFSAPDKVAYEGDRPNVWMAMDGPKALAIRRYAGPLGFDNEYVIADVRYTPLPDASRVVPPPGSPLAASSGNDEPEAQLAAALRKMQRGVWEVDATIASKKNARVFGLLSGRDFDLSMEPETEGTPIRQIAIKDKSWVSYDRGETWKKVRAEDRLLYLWVHSPILAKGILPEFETAGRESRDGESCLHLRLKVSEKLDSEKERPHYWLAFDPRDQLAIVRRYEGNLAFGEQLIYCAIEYRPAAKGVGIQPPPAAPSRRAKLPPPLDETLGFFDIEGKKFELAGKVVRVEITGKTLATDPIAGDKVRVMVKDTAERYGLVEFPRAGLEKLGLSASYAGKPVALYLLVTPQGEKPAAKLAAVGSKFVRGEGRTATYEW
jgi:hypothetical protein